MHKGTTAMSIEFLFINSLNYFTVPAIPPNFIRFIGVDLVDKAKSSPSPKLALSLYSYPLPYPESAAPITSQTPFSNPSPDTVS